MLRSFGIALVLALAAVATQTIPLGARGLTALTGVVTALSEPGTMVLLGTTLAALSMMVKTSKG